jgi:probable HAF family extracellular repeat protein
LRARTSAQSHVRGRLTSGWKSFGFALFAAVCLLGETAGSACAQYAVEWSGGGAVNLGGLPGATYSIAYGVNDFGQAVGSSAGADFEDAVEWSGGHVINLGGLPGFVDSVASSINYAGQVVGVSYPANGLPQATEWTGGAIINLGGLPGSVFSAATDINDSGQVVGRSFVGATQYAVEWSGGVINLGGLPGAVSSVADAINDSGQVVGQALSAVGSTASNGMAAASSR